MWRTKNLILAGVSFLAAGYWCNLQALWAYMTDAPLLKVLGDILPWSNSIGDCFLFVGYAVFAGLFGKVVGVGISRLVVKVRTGH